MSDAFYYQGLTIEYDISDPHLTIDGQQIKIVHEEGGYRAPNLTDSALATVKKESPLQLAELIIANWEKYRKRGEIKKEHLAILKEGVEHWNKWRRDRPETRPLLYEADLKEESGVDELESPDFSNANLINADLTGMTLIEPNFHEANLGRAKLRRAILRKANFCRTDLYETDFSDAQLIGANLQGTQLAKTIFQRASLTNCKIYGLSAWDLDLEGATQENHIIKYRYQSEDVIDEHSEEGEITVSDLEVAQFIYLLLHNKKIRGVIDTITSKVVLILGGFAPDRKAVLDALRDELRRRNYSPVVFDFEKPRSQSTVETVAMLAHMARFVIADLTDARSVLQELMAIVPLNPTVTVQPLILAAQEEPGMFDFFRRFPWVLQPFRYSEPAELLNALTDGVIGPAEAKALELRGVEPPE